MQWGIDALYEFVLEKERTFNGLLEAVFYGIILISDRYPTALGAP